VDQLIAPDDGTQRGHQFLHQASARPGRRERQLAPRDAVRDRPTVCARREKRRECLVPDGRVKHVPSVENVEPSPRLVRDLIDTHPALAGRDEITMPYLTQCTRADLA